jgi:shikimate kinase
VLSARVRAGLRAPGVLVAFVHAPVAVLAARIARDPHRPPLTRLPAAEEVAVLLRARLPLYESVADLELETSALNVDAACARIEAKIRDPA